MTPSTCSITISERAIGVAGVISPKPVEVSTVKEKYIRSDQLSLPPGPCAIVAVKALGWNTCRKQAATPITKTMPMVALIQGEAAKTAATRG